MSSLDTHLPSESSLRGSLQARIHCIEVSRLRPTLVSLSQRCAHVIAVFSLLTPNIALSASPAVSSTASPTTKAISPGLSPENTSYQPPRFTHPPARLGQRPTAASSHSTVQFAALTETPVPTDGPQSPQLPLTLGEQAVNDDVGPGLQAPQAQASSDPILVAGGGADQRTPVVAFNETDSEYLVVWTDNAAPESIRGHIMTHTGATVKGEFTLATSTVGPPFLPEVVFNAGDNSYMILWSEINGEVITQPYFTLDAYNLYALPVSSEGTPLAAEPTLITDQLTFYGGFFQGYDIAYNSTSDEYLVVWEQPPGAILGNIAHPHRVVAQRLGAGAGLIGSSVVLKIGVVDGLSLAYSSGSNEYLVTWDRFPGSLNVYDLYAQRIHPGTMAALGSEISLAQTSRQGWQIFPHSTYDPDADAYLVGWFHNSSTQFEAPAHVRGQFIKPGTGGYLGPNIPIIDPVEGITPRAPHIAYSQVQHQYLVTAGAATNVLAQYVSFGGWMSGATFPMATSASEQTVAARLGGDERHRLFLSVWVSAGDIYAGFLGNPVIPEGGVLSSCSDVCLAAYNATQRKAAKPINTRTGGYDLAITDLSVSTPSGPLVFERSYSSLAIDLDFGELGFGWTHNHAVRLIFPTDPDGEPGVVLFKAQSANRYEFIVNTDGTYTPAPGMGGSLTRQDGPPASYALVDERQNTYQFDEEGRLLSWTDPLGHSLLYSYDIGGRLITIEEETGLRHLDLSYDDQDRLMVVADHAGRQVAFAYDGVGDLVSATDVLGQLWIYSYDAEHHLTQVTDPRGVAQERTEFDGEGRAVRQYNGADELVVDITYNPDGTTTIVDARGNASTDEYDPRQTLTGGTDALGGTEARIYDVNFRPVSITDQGGRTTTLTWSADGANLAQVVDAEGHQTDLTYDSLNNLTELVDARGFLTTYTYNGSRLTSSTDALGNTTSYTYTPEGFLASVTDARGNTTSYTYDDSGQRTSMTNALGATWTYTYDELGRLVGTSDPFGRVVLNEYDNAGRLIRTTRNYDPDEDPNGDNEYNIVTEYAYDQVGQQVAVTDTYGRITHYEYDDAGRLIRTADPAGNETFNAYDESGNLIATTDALGRTTTFGYDELNRLIGMTDPMGNTTSTAYNPDGTLASRTDALGGTTTYTYDDLKRVVAVTDALGNTATTSYDEAGNVIAATDALGRTTSYEYDALNRLIRQTDALGGITEYFYDEVGNRIQTVDANGHATTYTYDALNRLVSVTDALGNATTYNYNAVGNRTRVTDANGHRTYFFYDPLGRLIEVDDALDNYTETAYDALGNVISRWDANGNATTFTYDVLNRLIQEINPLDGETGYAYDAVGNLVGITDANGNTTDTSYDELNRGIAVTDPNGSTTTMSYNALGSVLSTADALGNTTTYGYDALNRQVSATDPMGHTIEYVYDAVGNRVTMTDANGISTRYEYDDLNRLTAVIENFQGGAEADTETNVRTEYAYDLVGNRLTIRDANDHVTTFVYDNLNRLVGETDPLGNTTVYEFDAVGNRLSLTDAEGFTTSFDYDAVNRLTTIDYPDPDVNVTFAYDPAGNRLGMTDGVGSTTWTYDPLNRATEITDPFNATVSYGYDSVGNRTELGYPDGKVVNYSYDGAGRLVEVLDWEGQVTSYSYDPANRLETVALPNGVVSTYSYDEAGQSRNLTHEAGSVILSSFEYIYDAVGNRVQVVETLRQPGSLPEYRLFLPLVLNGAQGEGSGFGKGEATPTAAAATSVTPSPATMVSSTSEPTETPSPTLAPMGTWTPSPWPTETGTPVATPTATTPPAPSATWTATLASEGTPTIEPTATLADSAAAKGLPGLAAHVPARGQPASILPVEVITRTIDYSYDPLYRLTAADYDDGTFFHYTYDGVGNRQTQETQAGTDTYVYDEANELIEVNGVAFGWDDNGNLKSDGVRTYSYDHANRLTSVVHGADIYDFAYNGLGDRILQSVNGDTVEYTLDPSTSLRAGLQAGLTQVLSDGTNTYLYGAGRIGEQQPEGWQYHLGDALASVRQLADPTGAPRATQGYAPFGEVQDPAGSAFSSYGFGGEWADKSGLVYLRARYLSPSQGRFTQRDSWGGRIQQPYSLNPYPYAASNPINVRDPSGQCWDWSPQEGLVERIPLAPSDGPCPGSLIEGPDGEFDFSRVLSEGPFESLFDSGVLEACALPTAPMYWIGAAPGPLWAAVEFVREATVQVYLSGAQFMTTSPPTPPILNLPIFVTAKTVEALSWDTVRGSYPEVIGSVGISFGGPESGVSVVLRLSDVRGFGASVSLGVADCAVSIGAVTFQLSCLGHAVQFKLENLVQRQTWIAQTSRIADEGGYMAFGRRFAFPGVPSDQLHYYVIQTSYDKDWLARWYPGARVLEQGYP